MSAVILTLGIVFTGTAYLRGRNRRPAIAVWRACSFFLGLIAVWIAVASPIASLDRQMLTGHMIQHLLLMSIAPPLILMGEPLLALWPRRMSLVEKLARFLGHPGLCWFASTLVLILWHVPSMFQLAMRSPTWHFIEHASFIATGLLFWWPVIEPWPAVARWPRWSMLVYLFLATAPCDILAGLLVFSDRVVYPMHHAMPGMGPQMGAFSPVEDQQFAAALMWTCATVIYLVAGTIVSMEILSPKLGRQYPLEPAELEEVVSI